jgi:PAS domain S-box-containing protein
MADKPKSSYTEELAALRQENVRLKAAEAQRDQAEAALRESERRYRHLLDEADDIIYRADMSGRFTYFNAAAVRLTGYAAEEILGRHYLELICPRRRKATQKFYMRQVQERIPNTYYEYCLLTRKGREVWLGQKVQLIIENDELIGVQAVARDITARRRAESRLRQAYREMERRVEERTAELRQAQEALIHSEKLRAVGELASGVAHNVNNVLQAVLGYAELIPLAEGATEEIKHYARTITYAAEHGAEIVRRMQTFARKENVIASEVFDLTEIAREAMELTRPVWHSQAIGRGTSIEVTTRLLPQLWVLGSASEIREVCVNLVKNAAESMIGGGILRLHSFEENGQAVLEVADTGIGMDEATRQRVFEPFYTTKGVGEGIGLGLAVAWGIVNRHQGRISVQSTPGQGSVFRLYLPLTDQAVTTSQDPTPMALNGIRLLLVDDDPAVLEGLARALERSGAVVSVASDALQARDWLESHSAHCDIVLSDHGMVGLTGLELLSWVRHYAPHIRRVLFSGWGENLPGNVDASAAERILSKPLDKNTLIAALCTLPPANVSAPSVEG